MQNVWLMLFAFVAAINLRLIAPALLAYRGAWTYPVS
jgi:hypothetical protein